MSKLANLHNHWVLNSPLKAKKIAVIKQWIEYFQLTPEETQNAIDYVDQYFSNSPLDVCKEDFIRIWGYMVDLYGSGDREEDWGPFERTWETVEAGRLI